MTTPTGPHKMPKWLKATLWTLGLLTLAVLMTLHLMAGGGPSLHS